MANDKEPLLRNPSTGRYLSKFESMTRRANLAVAQHGLDPQEKELVALETIKVGMDSKAVQNYIVPMAKFLHDWQGDLKELSKIIPAIHEMNALAQKDDPALSVGEKKRIDAYAKELIGFVQKKTSLFTRSTAALKNIARQRQAGVAESLSNSPSAIFRMAGKALSPKSAKESADKDVLKTKAGIFSQLLRSRQQGLGQQPIGSRSLGRFDFDDDDEDDDQPTRRRTPKREPAVGKKKAEQAAIESNSTLDELLVVDRGILHQVTVTNQLLRTGNETTEQTREAQERAANDAKSPGAPVASTSKVVREKTPQAAAPTESLLGKGLDFAKILGEFSIAKMVLPFVEDGAMALGGALLDGAAIVAAGFVGWEIGKLLDDLSHHALSNAVQKFAEMFDPNIKGQQRITDKENQARANALDDPHRVSNTVDTSRLLPGEPEKIKSILSPFSFTNPTGATANDMVPIPSTSGISDQLGASTPVPPMSPMPARVAKAAPKTESKAPSTSPVKTKPAARQVVKIVASGIGFTDVMYNTGEVDHRTGPLSLRNNNPGNLRYGKTQVGTDSQGYAVFPTAEIGKKAQEDLLFTKNTKNSKHDYSSMTVADAIAVYAPPSENPTAKYQAAVIKSLGGRNPVLNTMNDSDRKTMMDTMVKLEAGKGVLQERMVASGRNAQPLTNLNASIDRGSGGGNTVIAPSNTVAPAAGGGAPMIIPPPMSTDNPDATARAIRSANAV